MSAAPAPPFHSVRTAGRPRRALSVVAVLAFVVTGVFTLFGGATSLVRSTHGEAELWLAAVPAGAPPVSYLSPRLSSDGYSLVHVAVDGIDPGSLVVHTATLLIGFLVLAGVSFFLAYLSWRLYTGRPFARCVTIGLAVCSGALLVYSVTAPLLFTLAHERIFAELAVDLSAAPFDTVDTFGMEDAVLFFAGLVLGLLSLVFGAAHSLLSDHDRRA